VKAEIFGIADLPGKKADDEVDPLIERLRSFDIKVGVGIEQHTNLKI
jgi:hypothetical protein